MARFFVIRDLPDDGDVSHVGFTVETSDGTVTANVEFESAECASVEYVPDSPEVHMPEVMDRVGHEVVAELFRRNPELIVVRGERHLRPHRRPLP